MEDPHKLKRGRLLGQWVDAHDGATACLIAAGYETGSKEFKSREAHLSIARKRGMGHKAAIRWESEFEPLGMTPGSLTNNLDGIEESTHRLYGKSNSQTALVDNRYPLSGRGTPSVVTNFAPSVSYQSATTIRRAPIISWGQMGADVMSGAVTANGELSVPIDFSDETVVWKVENDEMSPDYNPGDFIAVDSDPSVLANLTAGEAVIVETGSGSRMLRYYTPLADGHFEARPPASSRYGVLSTLQMALQIRAVVAAHLRVRRPARQITL